MKKYEFLTYARFNYDILYGVRVVVKTTNFIEFFFGLFKLFNIVEINNLDIFTTVN